MADSSTWWLATRGEALFARSSPEPATGHHLLHRGVAQRGDLGPPCPGSPAQVAAAQALMRAVDEEQHLADQLLGAGYAAAVNTSSTSLRPLVTTWSVSG